MCTFTVAHRWANASMWQLSQYGNLMLRLQGTPLSGALHRVHRKHPEWNRPSVSTVITAPPLIGSPHPEHTPNSFGVARFV